MGIHKLPDGSYAGMMSPSQHNDLGRMPTYADVVAWAIEDGEIPPTLEEYEAECAALDAAERRVGQFKGMTFIK